MQKRVLAIHDISCVGKCSLTVALPILSAAGLETSVLPTAVLSTHTGGFSGYTFRDLSEDILPILSHWESLSLRTDAVYTGYLAPNQVELVKRIFASPVAEGAFLAVDPVMADNGKLYVGFGEDFPAKMRDLCERADMILPNLTEAALLLGRPYRESYDKEGIEELLKALADLGPRYVILSGVSFEAQKIGAASYDKTTGEIRHYFTDQVKGMFHGTGDVFASALLAAFLSGEKLVKAVQTAVDFTLDAILRTVKAKTDIRYGVNFEEGLAALAERLRP